MKPAPPERPVFINLGKVKKLKIGNYILTSLVLLMIAAVSSNAQEFPAGVLTERVTLKNDSSQSYALYLPSNYDPQKKWPMLYCFEPVARGKLPVSIFQGAAEKYGFIVIGTYNSRNGMDGKTLSKYVSDLFVDTRARFSIDEKRIYTTGFSGGSRVASNIALSCGGCIRGVIGVGAGLPSGNRAKFPLPYLYFGAFGVDDYNYYEMRTLEKKFDESSGAYVFETFDGAHQWLTKELAETALEWMSLYAMKEGSLEKNEKFIDGFLAKRTAKAEDHISAKRFFEAYQVYRSIMRDFDSLRDVSGFKRISETMSKSGNLKKSIKEDEQQIDEQMRNTSRLMALGMKLQIAEERSDALQILRTDLSNLQKIAGEKEDSPRRRVARRSVNHVFAETYEAAIFQYERQKKFSQALLNLEVAAEIYPKSPQIWYDRARLYVLNGQEKRAIEALQKAHELGFKNFKEVEAEAAFNGLAQNEQFQKLITLMKTSQK